MHKKKIYILILLFLILAVASTGAFFLLRNNSKINYKRSVLEDFYNEKGKEQILKTVLEFSDISDKVTHYVSKDSTTVYPNSVNQLKMPKKIMVNSYAPSIRLNDSLHNVWENKYFEIIKSKILLDDDIVDAVNDVFMFYNLKNTTNSFLGKYSNKVSTGAIFYNYTTGRWLTLCGILKAKIKRRLRFF